jgi:predicted dehydrogenase
VSVRVALIGCGAWGVNLLRVLTSVGRESAFAAPSASGAEVVAVADPDRARLAIAKTLAPSAAPVPSLDDALALGVHAVVIATPPSSHAELSLRALEAGADVLVEKPLSLDAAEAARCAARAAALGRVAMVGHLLRYHPAVVRLLSLAQEGALGDVLSFGATRLSTSAGGRERGAMSALWTLGPHDVSILGALDGSAVRDATARVWPGRERVALEARLESGVAARIELGRSSPVKERRLRLLGTTRVAVFDDVRAQDLIVIAGRRGGIEREITVSWREPLAVEVEHFLRCVETREQPLTSFAEGAAVVRVLARAGATLAPQAEYAAGVG